MNRSSLKAILEAQYGFTVRSLEPAPRQFVAETYYVDVDSGQRYFCKVVEKPLFVESIQVGLPAIAELQSLGYENACFPLARKDGALSVLEDGHLIVLWTYINAPQSYDYDLFTLGQRIAEVHALTAKLTSEVPVERFVFKHADLFEEQFEWTLESGDSSLLHKEFQSVMRAHEAEVRGFYDQLKALSQALNAADYEMVFTHGDIGGNVLVKAPKHLYIVDWDENRLAPKERDLWTLWQQSGFLEGYRSVRPGAGVDEPARRYSILVYFFYALLHYFREIIDGPTEPHRRRMLTDLDAYFEGWIRPYLDSLE